MLTDELKTSILNFSLKNNDSINNISIGNGILHITFNEKHNNYGEYRISYSEQRDKFVISNSCSLRQVEMNLSKPIDEYSWSELKGIYDEQLMKYNISVNRFQKSNLLFAMNIKNDLKDVLSNEELEKLNIDVYQIEPENFNEVNVAINLNLNDEEEKFKRYLSFVYGGITKNNKNFEFLTKKIKNAIIDYKKSLNELYKVKK